MPVYSERARRYMAAMEEQHGPDYLHELYQTYQPVWSPEGEEEPMPFRWWVEERAAEWEASQTRIEPQVTVTELDILRMQISGLRSQLRTLQAKPFRSVEDDCWMWQLEGTIRRLEDRLEEGEEASA